MSDLQELVDAIDLEALFDEEGIDYKRTGSGTNIQVRECLWCGDDNWRTYASVEKKLGVCFKGSCGQKWNLFGWVRRRLGGDQDAPNKAVFERLHQLADIPYAPRARTASVTPLDWRLPLSVALPTPEGATHPYLLTRGVLPETQRLYNMRWCEKGAYEYEDAAGERKSLWFGGRILLPIADLEERPVSFVGRDATGKAEIRYLFPPLLPSAASCLYGAWLLPGAHHVVLGEGPFDAIAIHQAVRDHPDFRGVRAAGSFGLSLGDGQLSQLRALRARPTTPLERVTMLWDGEEAALARALEAGAKVAAAGIETRIGLLPPGADPGELDTAAIRKAIAEARPLTPSLHLELALQNPYRVCHR